MTSGAVVLKHRLPIRQSHLHIAHPIHIDPAGNWLLCWSAGNIHFDQKRFYAGGRVHRHGLDDCSKFSGQINRNIDRSVRSGRQVPRLLRQLRDRAPAGGMNAVHHHYFFRNVGQIKCEVRTTISGLGTVFLRLGIPRDIARRLAGRLGKR